MEEGNHFKRSEDGTPELQLGLVAETPEGPGGGTFVVNFSRSLAMVLDQHICGECLLPRDWFPLVGQFSPANLTRKNNKRMTPHFFLISRLH